MSEVRTLEAADYGLVSDEEPRTITFNQVIKAGTAVANEWPDRENSSLRYTSPCLVGAILQRLDVDLSKMVDPDNGLIVSAVQWEKYGIRITNNAIRILAEAQDAADCNHPWGESWDRAAGKFKA